MGYKEVMDESKFCFIICSNNQLFLNECLFYISKIKIPDGYVVENLIIKEAKSMTSGYNEGMKTSNAKYKIYIHQDVFILNRNLLYDMLQIFDSDHNIGMVGVVGSQKMPIDGVMWHGYRKGNLYGFNKNRGIDGSYDYSTYQFNIEDGLLDVVAIDGLFMATSKDLLWREDLFDRWDFYDVSQSFEMKRKGYRIVVPVQNCPWCLHDDMILDFNEYNRYRNICLQEYKEFFS